MKKQLGFGLVALCGLVVGTLACGSSSSDEVFAAADAGSGSGSDGSSVGTGVDDGGSTAQGGDGGVKGDDGGTATDASPGGTTTALTCGTTSCSIPAQTCCTTRTAASSFDFFCVNGGTCPTVVTEAGTTKPVALGCSSAANCASGEECCLTSANGGTTSSCKPNGTCSGGGGDTALLCDPANPTAGCPTGEPCSSKNIAEWRLPNGFGTCGGEGR